MVANLLRTSWADVDSYELRLLLNVQIPGPGQSYEDATTKLHIPTAGALCRLILTYEDNKITCIERGTAFDADEWDRISREVESALLAGRKQFGRALSFNTFKVTGGWRGKRSEVQILAPSQSTPKAPVEAADHPFILEFPLQTSTLDFITEHRRLREHRHVTSLLNILLRGRTQVYPPLRPESFWV